MAGLRCLLSLLLVVPSVAAAQDSELLPGTRPLTWEEDDLSPRLMDGAHRFVERKMADAAERRAKFWPGDVGSIDEWLDAVEPNRQRLRTIIGAVDQRLPPRMENFGSTIDRSVVHAGLGFGVLQVRWPVVEGVFGEGLLIEVNEPVAAVVLIPDAGQTPEQLLGMERGVVPVESQLARQLLKANVEVLIPTLVGRDRLETEDPRLKRSDQTSREWLYRQAFHMGRHIIGYEVQTVQAGIDWLKVRHERRATAGHRGRSPSDVAITARARDSRDEPVGVAGYGEGGLIALFAAAIDPRIDSVLVSGYFDSREDAWSEPIYRNVWSRLRRFGDAEIASLIQPRQLIIEYSEAPTIVGHKGDSKTPALDRVRREVDRIRIPPEGQRAIFVHGDNGAPVPHYSPAATSAFFNSLQVEQPDGISDPLYDNRKPAFSPKQREQRRVSEIERHVQQLIRKSEHVRDEFFLYKAAPELKKGRWSTDAEHPVYDAHAFQEAARAFREQFRTEAMGRFDADLLPANPRVRRVIDNDKWTAWDVVLDVYPDLFAWGVLLVPKDLKPGEKRPVVVCQHGRNGVPRDTIDHNKTAYNNFAAQLAERGFITFAPHNLYRFEDRYRWLDRKANTIGCTLFSFIIAQHEQILNWMSTLPFVDDDRIAFYGLSYGGETAVRVPTALERYCLSICSGDFNQWTRKVAATDQPFSFMRTIEWEMPYWNLGHTFDYAEMTYLMVPRPFMVERGHWDLVGRDRWVAHEYAKVRWLYAQLGLADRTEITFFQGGHSIRGEATFAFLHRHLNWPQRP